MGFDLTSLAHLSTLPFDTLIDVRSPSEFEIDHIPGAINLPVLSDAERAHVGTIYKQESPFKARKVGAALVAANASVHLQTALADMDGGWRPLVYCWRGGQRSGSFATILRQIGWRADTIEGGYRTYRRLVVQALHDTPLLSPVVLLDGNTGTGKTKLLKLLASRGLQTIDLEGLAGHRGSALGSVGVQPSQKMFESRLAELVSDLDPKQPVVIEAESSRIGQLNLPGSLWTAMQSAPRVEIAVPARERAKYLVDVYAKELNDVSGFNARLTKLVPLQGRNAVQEWQKAIAGQDHLRVAEDLINRHYDPRYTKARSQKFARILTTIKAEKLDSLGFQKLAESVAEEVKKFGSESHQMANTDQ